MQLLIATGNEGKKREFQALLRSLDVPLLFPTDLGLRLRVPEDRDSYRDNALQKAAAHCVASGLLTIADDSGLEVDALDGAPGLHSARCVPGTDADRLAALLRALEGVPSSRRTARFRCVLAVVTPSGMSRTFEGVCEGVVTQAPTGAGGFGYDPVFSPTGLGTTMAALAPETKNRISHRARAVQAALPWLRGLVQAGTIRPGTINHM